MFKNFRDLLAILYLPFVLIWVFGLVILGIYAKLNTIEIFGLGAGTGIILTKLADIIQFYFRKKEGE